LQDTLAKENTKENNMSEQQEIEKLQAIIDDLHIARAKAEDEASHLRCQVLGSPEKLQAKIERIIALYKKMSKAFDGARGIIDPNSDISSASWGAFCGMLKEIDQDNWISWHIWENECGKNEFDAIINGEKVVVKTPADLAKVMLS
jgi:hypothetical protein